MNESKRQIGPVMFDHRVWKNWEGASLEAVEILNEMLKPCGVRILIDWERGDDFTMVSILQDSSD
jgi:hypothetical protein